MAKPPPVEKKRGLGCCGCGCVVLALLVVLIFGVIGASLYVGYSTMVKVTSAEPSEIPSFDGGDQVYNQATQKVETFTHDTQSHTPATLHLTSDEINTLIAHNPELAKRKILIFVTLHDDQARVQSSIPSKFVSHDTVKGRYLNSDVTLGVNFDSDTRNINLNLKSAQVGDTVLPEDKLAGVQAITDPVINGILQQDPAIKSFLSQTNSIEIKNSELVIETK